MPALRHSILSNYAGQIWTALMSVVFVPLYIRMLGMEAFGLVGLMLSIQALSVLLDLGMGGVLNRELARRTHDPAAAATRAGLVRTFEWLVWPLAVMIAVSVALASPLLANHWLHPQLLSRAETARAVAVMGIAVGLQWPASFYANGLSGLERQLAMNLISILFATLRGAGVLVVLAWVSPTINAFMWWYAAMGACQSLLSAAVLWRSLRGGGEAVFRTRELRNARRFAGGLVAITALAVTVTQLDRIVLSAMRPIAELGYFSLALSVAAGIGRLVQPMFNALYPRYSRLVFLGQQHELSELYHLSNQLLSVVVSSTALTLIFFAGDVIELWTGDAAMARTVALPLRILAAGTLLNGAMNLPYALQLAHGWTRLSAVSNLIALVLGLPLCIWAISRYGINGAALLWFTINLGFVAIGVPMMHRRLLRGEASRWFLQDMLPSLLAAATAGMVLRLVVPAIPRSFTGLVLLTGIAVVELTAAALAAPAARRLGKEWLDRRLGTARAG